MRVRLLAGFVALAACAPQAPAGVPRAEYDVVIRDGTVYDGSGGPPIRADVAIRGDTVAPGFINMLSWANASLLHDGRSQGDIRQGVTLEVFGEGTSMGPITDSMRQRAIASFVGATTVRIHEIGYADRPPTPAELSRMEVFVEDAMREGALGVGSSLIYAPANFAATPELIGFARAAGRHGGIYISHIRDEGGKLLSSTGLDATMPTWVQEGGFDAWVARLRDPATRARLKREMAGAGDYDNAFANAARRRRKRPWIS